MSINMKEKVTIWGCQLLSNCKGKENRDIMENLITEITPYLKRIAWSNSKRCNCLTVDDLYQQQVLAIYENIDDWIVNRHDRISLWDFIGAVIHNNLYHYINDKDGLIRVPQQTRKKIWNSDTSMTALLGANATNMSSLDIPTEDDNNASLYDVIEGGVSPEAIFIANEEKQQLISLINTVLTEREKDIVIKYFFLEEGINEICTLYDIQQNTVHQNISRAIKKLRKVLA